LLLDTLKIPETKDPVYLEEKQFLFDEEADFRGQENKSVWLSND